MSKDQSAGRSERSRMLGVGFGLTVLVAILSMLGAFDRWELDSLDWRFERRGPRAMSVDAVIVAIDDESLNGWAGEDGKPQYMPDRWVWPRDFHARVVQNLKAAGAKLIVFDIVFSESSKRDPAQDQAFADAVKAAGNVIMAERHVMREDRSIKTETLIPGLRAGALDRGHANAMFSEEGALREFQPLYFNSAGQLDPSKPNLELVVLRQILAGKALDPSIDMAAFELQLKDRRIPFSRRGSLEINYAGGPGTVPTFPYHSVYFQDMDMGVFRDKIVYIGATSPILHDNHIAPFSPASDKMPGVEAHVHFLDTLLAEQYLKRLPRGFDTLISLILGLLISVLTFRVNAKLGAVVMIAVGGGYAAAAMAAFLGGNWVLPFATPMLAVAVSYAGLASYRAYSEEKRARHTRQMFSRYVSKQIVEEIMNNPGAVQLGGAMKEVTILFSDVRGFTAMSERLSAHDVVEVLNEYLTAMVDIVIANNGTLDKYVGDAIMAVWGSPLPDPQHKQNAMRTAVQMMEVLTELQAKWKAEGKPHIDIGIGLNTGHVVAGNMGHPEYKMDYTVIGDDVNLAARMESANKEMKSHILITGSTYEGCESMVEVVQHPAIKVKGKAKAIEVYEVIGWKGQGRAPWAQPLP